MAFANSFTVVGLGTYIVCRTLALAVPDLLFSIGQSWFHTFNLNSVKTVIPFNIETFLFGTITFAIFVWITSYAFAKTYNSFQSNFS